MVIIVSGTPGTGKTTLAKKLSEKLHYQYLPVQRLIHLHHLKESYDQKRKCFVVDTKKLNKILIAKIKENKDVVIDSHLSHDLPTRYVDVCIITKCNLKVLEKRLKKKGYNKEKRRENLDCEIFDVCLNEAQEAGHNVIIVDTTKGINIKEILKKIQ